MGKLKVGIIAPSMRYVGGQAVQADLLMRLWQNDPDVECRFIPIDPPLPRLISWAGSIRGLRTILRAPIYYLHLWSGLTEVDIAHIFSASYWSFLLAPAPAWLLAKLIGKKNIINYRSGEARDHLKRFRSAKFVLSRADEIVTPSNYLVDVFYEFGLRAIAIPNLIDLSQFHYRERNPLRPHLVCTRGFSNYYAVDLVVRAFAAVKKQFPKAMLVLLGAGPLESAIREQVSDLGLTGVTFVGVASRQEIGKYYDQADIFINASWLDNMPVSILEAFASGTPVVTTGPEGIRYMVTHERTALLSEPGDWRALADNVLRLLTNPELGLRLARNGLEESKRYLWSAVRPQWLQVYRSMARGSAQNLR